MKMSDLVNKHLVLVHLRSHTKEEVISEIADQIHACKKNENKRQIISKILAREKQGSTGIGNGVAIPHARIEGLKEVVFLWEFPSEV